MRILFSFLLFLFCFPVADAQEKKDSLGFLAKKYIVRNFPRVRTLDVQYEQGTRSDYKLKWKGKSFEEGRFRNLSKLKLSSTWPVYKAKHLTVYTNFRYNYYHFESGTPSAYAVLFPRRKNDYHYWEVSVNATYGARLFHKPVLYTVNLAGDGSEKGFEKIRGMMVATMVLKRTSSTVISVGIVGMVNTGAIYPVLPVFSYWHKFDCSGWILDIGGPGYAYFRRSLTRNDRLSVGVSLRNEHFYIHTRNERMPKTCYFSKNELKTGVVYEYLLGKHVCFTANAGGITSFRSRLFNKKRINRKPYVDYTQHMNAFFNLGISYNLF